MDENEVISVSVAFFEFLLNPFYFCKSTYISDFLMSASDSLFKEDSS